MGKFAIADGKVQYAKQEKQLKAQAKKDKAFQRDVKMLEQMQKGGTLSDKITALMMKVQKFQELGKVCDFDSLDELINIARKKSRHQAMEAITGLKELFLINLLTESEPSEEEKSAHYLYTKLKQKYSDFIDILRNLTMDTVAFNKKIAIQAICELLIAKDIYRDMLLDIVINKLGEPKSATWVILEINQLVRRKRELLLPIVKLTSSLGLREASALKTRFYAIVLLNSLKYLPGDQDEIKIVVITLLKMFPKVIEIAEDQGSKTIALLLQAVNKLFPILGQKKEVYDSFYETESKDLYRLAHHKTNSNVRIQVIRFLYLIEKHANVISDRYYRLLYDTVRPDNFTNAINYRSASIFFNTLMQAIKDDTSFARIKAFVKRILQCCLLTETQFTCACLILVSEIQKIHPAIRKVEQKKLDSDEEEVYEDIPDSDDEAPPSKPKPSTRSTPQTPSTIQYDPVKREPKFANADFSPLHELNILSHHYHPTVSKWATQLLNSQEITYQGDPLLDFTLINFLDRFSYRDPSAPKKRGRVRRSQREAKANTLEFEKTPEEHIREDELFLHKYFQINNHQEIEEADEDEDWEEFGAGEEGDDFAELDGLEFDEEPIKRGRFADVEEYEHILGKE